MSEIKTQVNDGDVNAFLNTIDPEDRRADSFALLKLFSEVTGEDAKMWGTSIVGFGKYHYKSERSKQEGDWMLTGFSPRKQNLTIYIMDGFDDYQDLLKNIGKHKTSKGCLYVNKLVHVDQTVLRELIGRSYRTMQATNK
jgi:hypothetical protein